MDLNLPPVHTCIKVLFLNLTLGFLWKARFSVEGHLVDLPTAVAYFIAVSHDIVCNFLIISTFNNPYLQ